MWVTRKIDGETWFLVRQSGQLFLASPSGRVLAGDMPILRQAARLPEGSIVAGELYARMPDRRERVGDLGAALARDGADAPDGIAFAVFDGIQLAHQPLPIAYDEKLQALSSYLTHGSHLQVIEALALHTGLEVLQHFESTVLPSGGEGLVVRHASGIIYKIKPEISLDMAVIGYTVKADQPQACRSLRLGCALPTAFLSWWVPAATWVMTPSEAPCSNACSLWLRLLRSDVRVTAQAFTSSFNPISSPSSSSPTFKGSCPMAAGPWLSWLLTANLVGYVQVLLRLPA
jgi:hypothetical protein